MTEFRIELGENMNSTDLPKDYMPDDYFMRSRLRFLILLISCTIAAFAQAASQTNNSAAPFSIRATHLLGFEGAPINANGTLSVQDSALQFQKDGRPAVQVKIASVQDILLGEESKQVGGLPMTLGKTAAPFGGGRVVSLFAHKKYDTLAMEYVDANGGFHGAIFQLNKGQAEILKNELVARGAHVRHSEGEPTKQNAEEAPSESK